MELVRTLSEIESSIDEVNSELEAKIKDIKMKRSGLIFVKVTSMQPERYKTKTSH